MIGKIKGILVEVENNQGLIETTSGVSYQVFLTQAVLRSTEVNSKIDVFTYLQVREDALVLFGFGTKDDLFFFKMLLTVPGVGPKTAYSVVSISDSDKIMQAVKNQEVEKLTQIPGLGRKTALKIILELSPKFKDELRMDKIYLSEDDKLVIDALVSLGLSKHESAKLLDKVDRKLSVEKRIKAALNLATSARKEK